MQQEIRNRTKYLITFYGSTQQFIALNVGVSRNTISLFIKGKRELAPTVLNKLDIFLKETNI